MKVLGKLQRAGNLRFLICFCMRISAFFCTYLSSRGAGCGRFHVRNWTSHDAATRYCCCCYVIVAIL